jgi:hypothetical protein
VEPIGDDEVDRPRPVVGRSRDARGPVKVRAVAIAATVQIRERGDKAVAR